MTYATGFYGLGQVASAAGPINGIATLKIDLQRSAANAVEAYGSNVTFDRPDYESFLRQVKDNPNSLVDRRTNGSRIRNYISGVIVDVASAVARAEQLAGVPVSSATARAENHSIQAELIGAARIALDSANVSLRGVVPVQAGSSGLGVIPIAVLLVAGGVQVILGLAFIAAAVYVFDAVFRLSSAHASARELCAANRGCTPEQYGALVSQLRLGPFDTLAEGGRDAARRFGESMKTVGIVAGVTVASLGALYFLFGTQAGRRTLGGVREEAKR